MRASHFVAALFAAGALAAPVHPKLLGRAIVVKEVVEVVTVTVTEGGPAPTQSINVPQVQPLKYTVHGQGHRYTHHSIPIVTHPVSVATPIPSSSPVETSVTPSEPAPTPSSSVVDTPTSAELASQPTSSPSDGSPLSDGVSYLTTINKWRSAYNLPTLTWSSKLEANAQKTGTDDGGVNENHELNPGSMAQVITPGQQVATQDLEGDSPFEVAYVGWLCEVPSDPELMDNGLDQCALVKKALNLYYTETGHHDILTSTSYSQIGCYFAVNPATNSESQYQGLYVCDLA